MTSPTHPRLERLAFSAKDEDFQAFSELFEARIRALELGDCLESNLKVPVVTTQEAAAKTTARDQAKEGKKRHKFIVWCELVQ